MFFPSADSILDLSENRFRQAGLEPEERSGIQSEIKAQRVVALGDVKAEARPIGIGVEIISGGNAPSSRAEQETMVAKVIIGIVDGNREDNAPPQFLKVHGGLRTLAGNEFNEFQIARTREMIGAVAVPQQGHSRGKMNAFPSLGPRHPVETPSYEGPVAVAE